MGCGGGRFGGRFIWGSRCRGAIPGVLGVGVSGGHEERGGRDRFRGIDLAESSFISGVWALRVDLCDCILEAVLLKKGCNSVSLGVVGWLFAGYDSGHRGRASGGCGYIM